MDPRLRGDDDGLVTVASAAIESAATVGGGTLPRHVAIIMDGNGRWAKKRFLPRAAGHRKGIEAVRAVTRASRDLGLEVLSLYAFSSENWRRPAAEVSDLMGLLKHFIRSDLDELAEANVRLRVIGDHGAFTPDVVEMIDGAIERTAGNSGQTLCVALNYGAHNELVRAARKAVEAGEIDEASIAANLDTAGLPPVDLLIRTSGEQRLSNFMLWQAAYAELLFTETLWPDFGADGLRAALDAYGSRERRFGGL